MHSYFKFGDIDTRKYGILVTGTNPYSTPARDITATAVLGRNGDILIDNGRFKNAEVTYTCELAGDGSTTGFIERFSAFRKAMAMATGYQTLVDSYNPGITREAYLSATITPTAKGQRWLGGSFAVSFSCKPQRYTAAGQTRVALGSVIKGAIVGAESVYTGDDGALKTSNSYCRCGAISVSGGSTITLTHTHTAHDQVSVFIVQYDANFAHVKSEWKSVPKGGSVVYTLEDNTRRIRLCWNYNTLKTTDDSDPQILSCYAGSKVYRFGSDRVYYYFSGAFETAPVVDFACYSNVNAAKYMMDGVYVRIGNNASSTIGGVSVTMDCESEMFTAANGRKIMQYIALASNEEVTRPSSRFPTLRRGWNYIQSYNATTVYDPIYALYLTTREWEV